MLKKSLSALEKLKTSSTEGLDCTLPFCGVYLYHNQFLTDMLVMLSQVPSAESCRDDKRFDHVDKMIM